MRTVSVVMGDPGRVRWRDGGSGERTPFVFPVNGPNGQRTGTRRASQGAFSRACRFCEWLPLDGDGWLGHRRAPRRGGRACPRGNRRAGVFHAVVHSRPARRERAPAIDAYWRAANYLSVGQIYLLDNPLLREPLRPEHIKPRLLGHWGTTPGPELPLRPPEPGDPRPRPGHDLRHRARPRRARAWSPTPTSRAPTARSTPTSPRTTTGMRRLFRQFSFPGGIPSHVAPETPGSIHEGGELGLLAVARLRRGVRQPRPDRRLRDRRRRGRDRAAGGELALEQVPRPARATARCCRSCTSTATRSPTRRCSPGSPRTSCARCCEGYGYAPLLRRAATTRRRCTRQLAATLDDGARRDRRDPAAARDGRRRTDRPRWPMIVLRTPKGWTGPKEVDGAAGRGHVPRRTRCRSPTSRDEPRAPARSSRTWMRSYRPEELFDERRRAAPGARRARARRASGG